MIFLSEKMKVNSMNEIIGDPEFHCEPTPAEPKPETVFVYDVMIDIETMSLSKHNALILSIGMVEFDASQRDGLRFGKRSLLLPSILHQLALGREVSKSTQKFWMDQSPGAKEHWLWHADDQQPLADIIRHVREFTAVAPRIWANGTQFDLSNIEHLADQIGETEPVWYYQKPRDMRTFCAETPQSRIMDIGPALDPAGYPHEPIHDCIVQAHRVWSHWQEK